MVTSSKLPLSSSTPRQTLKSFVPRSSSSSGLLGFACGAAVALLVVWAVSSVLGPVPVPIELVNPSRSSHPATAAGPGDADSFDVDPAARTFYDDPTVTNTIDGHMFDWDDKRREWLRLHPTFAREDAGERVVLVTGSQPGPCSNPVGDHLLLRFFKNKVDYCRRHGVQLFYNTALLHPIMHTYWAKYPVVRAAMLAHPEAEWVWWVDSDAAFTDMDFFAPLSRYRDHNLIVHGWPDVVYSNKSWVSLNAGVFMIRNCQWSLDFIDVWASAGPQTPDYDKWGETLRSEFKDKQFPESNDQSALVYLLIKHRDTWGTKIYLEDGYYFEGYWVEIIGRLDNMSDAYVAMERNADQKLRRRHAEVAAAAYGRARDEEVAKLGMVSGPEGWRRPFITHFAGCQPCSGDHNKIYSGENCWEGMQRALHFADDQVLRDYGYRHDNLASAAVRPLPFDFPATVQ